MKAKFFSTTCKVFYDRLLRLSQVSLSLGLAVSGDGSLVPSHGKLRGTAASDILFPLCFILYFIEILSLASFQRKDTLSILELCLR